MQKPEAAIHSPAFPCNPIPFANRIAELCTEQGTPAISSAEAKACLWILVQQAYGQMVTLDTVAEYSYLCNSVSEA